MEARENCGVVAAYSLSGSNVIPMVIDCLRALQHRGQEAWGIAVPKMVPYKRYGLVSKAAPSFSKIVERYASRAAIGHVRYSTVGKSNLRNAQPLKVRDLCIAHNGTISNFDELASMTGLCSFTPQSMSDTLVAATRLVDLLGKSNDMPSALDILRREIVGSFAFTFVTNDGRVYAARDPKGFRPLVLGYHEESSTYIVASESCALDAVGAELLRDVEPGELVTMDDSGLSSEIFAVERPHAHCAFEYTYFAHPSSVMEGISIYSARKSIGRVLARKYQLDADIVIPVPDSARPAALGYAEEMGIPFEEGLMKDRYSRKGPIRSFIEPYQHDRMEIVRRIIPIRSVIEGRDVIVIDDSIVRGTSSISIVNSLRSAGARSIKMLVCYPPIRFPCYAGIDFPSQEELIAYRVSSEKECSDEGELGMLVAKAIGVEFVGYNDMESLASAIGLPKEELCFTCHTGNYENLKIKPLFRSRQQLKGGE
ncbi:MAG: amidophosphoribosyltransferase [Candidatus Nitrosocaldus sp.]|nr:amidophosphoribosyltransferase [Candidatus Nitrosocaldus sp.]MDW8275944.1 amidophosphoribosyltransferase [Candidatus Nitrosocaldus sp.]